MAGSSRLHFSFQNTVDTTNVATVVYLSSPTWLVSPHQRGLPYSSLGFQLLAHLLYSRFSINACLQLFFITVKQKENGLEIH